MTDRDRTVSRRSKPSSRIALIDEQSNPWHLLQPQDAMSRHRGAKQFRQYELSRIISLLSLAYLLSVNRYLFHSIISDHYNQLLKFLFNSPIKQLNNLIAIILKITKKIIPNCLCTSPLPFRRLPPQPN